ncbi:class I SAM-dependent methyltransferase [Tamlana crocina]|uniref:Class I SAM-dependent methyltransferase n=1 Tax=Tamlana crocina TaxID=393006 RepID=A0ABX1D8L2_9FLAO|nr:class I SAM-dependent methyltransferase [Tamlana crocina]NJX14708.1 class I SAM-dependent methyltransferase [Tamlana crocina]
MTHLVEDLKAPYTDIKNLASQLSCPNGDEGIAIGKIMNQSNQNMVLQSIKALNLEEKNRVLELGHGNAAHVPHLMKQAIDLRYFGMEISSTMKQQAEQNNTRLIKKKWALFQLYDGKNIDYVPKFFDRILTVNTIYFWEKPLEFLNEMFRLLKPEGLFVLTFVDKDFMERLPFVSEQIFNLYNTPKLKKLIEQTQFKTVSIKSQVEPALSKTGEMVNREYTIVALTK